MAVRVRDGTRDDLPEVHRMIHELATFEGCPRGPELSVEELAADGFDSSPPWFFLLVAEEEEGGLVGYALCNRAYSSWTRRALYLEDLYVRPSLRGRGVGGRLVRALCRVAAELGAARIDWHVLESNRTARAFYRGLGARDLRESEGRAALRLDREHILRLAADTPTVLDA